MADPGYNVKMSGNGADLGQVIAMLGDMVTTQHQQGRALNALTTEVRKGLNEVREGLNEVRGGLNEVRGGLSDVRGSVSELRQAVAHYHASVLGHGILISELDARLRRVEDHLKLPPIAA